MFYVGTYPLSLISAALSLHLCIFNMCICVCMSFLCSLHPPFSFPSLCSSVHLCVNVRVHLFRTQLSRFHHHLSLLICAYMYVCVSSTFSFSSFYLHLGICVCTVCLFCPRPLFSPLLIYTSSCMCMYVCMFRVGCLHPLRPHTSLSSCFFSLLPRGQTSLPLKPLRVRYLRTIFNSNCIFVQV